MLKPILIAASIALACDAHADLLADPSSTNGDGRTKAAGVFVSSEIEYESDDSEFDVERKILGIELSHGVSREVDVIGQAGFIMDTEVERIDEDGDGFLFGGGARFEIAQSGSLRLLGFGLLSFQTEEIKDGSFKLELDTHELHTGVVSAFHISRTIIPYAGLDIILFDDGEAKASNGNFSSEDDVERDDMFSLKLGANLDLASVTMRPEVTILGEQTFLFAVGAFF